jgi:hypothetical protein
MLGTWSTTIILKLKTSIVILLELEQLLFLLSLKP